MQVSTKNVCLGGYIINNMCRLKHISSEYLAYKVRSVQEVILRWLGHVERTEGDVVLRTWK